MYSENILLLLTPDKMRKIRKEKSTMTETLDNGNYCYLSLIISNLSDFTKIRF